MIRRDASTSAGSGQGGKMMRTRRSPWRRGAALLAVGSVVVATMFAGSGMSHSSQTISSFNYGLPVAIGSLDLTKNMNGWTSAVAVMVTQPLERFDRNAKSTLVLARSVTQPNRTTVVYKLRPGVKFSNGKALTARDVKWAVDHAVDGANGAQTASILTSIAGARVTGPLEVTVSLKRPDPAIRGSVAFGVLVQDSARAIAAGKDLGTAAAPPIGTGPFKYASYTASSVTLTRNDGYRGRRPSVNRLVFSSFPEDTTAQLAMRSGSIQANYVNAPKSTPAWRRISGTTIYATRSLLSTFLTMDTSSAPFNDVHARRAIAYLTDRKNLVRPAYGRNAYVMRSIAPDGEIANLAPSRSELNKFLSGLPQYPFSIARARAELRQSATPNGFSVEVPYPSSETWVEPVLLSLQQTAKQIGITITLKPQTFIEWATDIYTFKLAKLGVFLIGDLQPDPNGGMALMVGKANAVPTSFNMANWTPATVEPQYRLMTQASNKTVRWSATKKILSMAAQQVPYVPLFVPDVVLAYGKGYTSARVPDFMDFINGAWLDNLRRASE
jgi:peptide/nickel transport system substrate-binding protein